MCCTYMHMGIIYAMVCFRLRRRSKVYIYTSLSLCVHVWIYLYIYTQMNIWPSKKRCLQTTPRWWPPWTPSPALGIVWRRSRPNPALPIAAARRLGKATGWDVFFFPVDDVILVICNRRFDHQHVGDTVICEHLNHEHISFKLSKCHLIIF